MRQILFLSQFFIFSFCFGQSDNNQSLFDTAINKQRPLFVFSKPLKITRLDKNEIWFYAETFKNYSNQKLDTALLLQIINNCKYSDTILWTDNELTKSLLIKETSKNVSLKYAQQKFELVDEKQIKFYKKQINKFNSTETIDRVIEYFSRPVFDNSGKYAIIEWDNGHSYLGGGGGIILYQLQSDNKWKELGTISQWKY